MLSIDDKKTLCQSAGILPPDTSSAGAQFTRTIEPCNDKIAKYLASLWGLEIYVTSMACNNFEIKC